LVPAFGDLNELLELINDLRALANRGRWPPPPLWGTKEEEEEDGAAMAEQFNTDELL
jgi:hypothetical protein